MIKFWNKYRNHIILIVLSVLIIAAGIIVPQAFIRLKTRGSALPEGNIDIASIEPYGGSSVIMESLLSKSINACHRIANNETVNFEESRNVSSSTGFSEIGIAGRSQGLPTDDKSSEFVNEFFSLLEANLYTDLSNNNMVLSELNLASGTDRNLLWLGNCEFSYDDFISMYYMYDPNFMKTMLLDPSLGVPVLSHISFTSQQHDNIIDLESAIRDLYESYTGMDFSTEDMDMYYYWQDGYDISCQRSFRSLDGRISLSIHITSGWYWEEPYYEGDQWHATDDFIWHIYVYMDDYS